MLLHHLWCLGILLTATGDIRIDFRNRQQRTHIIRIFKDYWPTFPQDRIGIYVEKLFGCLVSRPHPFLLSQICYHRSPGWLHVFGDCILFLLEIFCSIRYRRYCVTISTERSSLYHSAFWSEIMNDRKSLLHTSSWVQILFLKECWQ